MKEALFYKTEGEDTLLCTLCPQNCQLQEGQKGFCGVRQVKEGKLYSLNYGEVSSVAMDPVEKKPLYHFYPGTQVFSLGTRGCNFKCPYCQNWSLSQKNPEVQKYSPREVVTMALNKNCSALAYTYSEPLVWYEFVKDTAELAAEEGLKNILVTNGFINTQPLTELLPLIDAANVDLKAGSADFYRQYCRGERQPVLETITTMAAEIHLELTTLVITDLNDDPEEMQGLFDWIADINPDIPLHLSRYFPRYQLKKKATSLTKMQNLYQLATDRLNYVYLGNTGLADYNNTACQQCAANLITRSYYQVESSLEEGCCPHCGQEMMGEF